MKEVIQRNLDQPIMVGDLISTTDDNTVLLYLGDKNVIPLRVTHGSEWQVGIPSTLPVALRQYRLFTGTITLSN